MTEVIVKEDHEQSTLFDFTGSYCVAGNKHIMSRGN